MFHRIGTFTLPEAARPEFEARSRQTMALLRKQPGFIADMWFEKVSGDGAVDIVIIGQWRDEASIRAAGAAIGAMHAASGFDLTAFFSANGIVANAGVYRARDLDIPA